MPDEAELPIDFEGLSNSAPATLRGYAAVVSPDTANAQGYEVSNFALKKPPAPRWQLPFEKPRKVDPFLPLSAPGP